MKPRETDIGPISDLDEFKIFLGPLAADYSDEQLRDLQRDMHVTADVLLGLYLEANSTRFDTSRPAN